MFLIGGGTCTIVGITTTTITITITGATRTTIAAAIISVATDACAAISSATIRATASINVRCGITSDSTPGADVPGAEQLKAAQIYD